MEPFDGAVVVVAGNHVAVADALAVAIRWLVTGRRGGRPPWTEWRQCCACQQIEIPLAPQSILQDISQFQYTSPGPLQGFIGTRMAASHDGGWIGNAVDSCTHQVSTMS